MQKFLLSKEHIFNLVRENRYRSQDSMGSRCIDGRYMTSNKLPALAFPGGDAGDLLMMFSSAKGYGFSIDRQKAWETLVKVVGEVKKLGFHTDSHAAPNHILGGCGHIGQIALAPSEYNLEAEDLDFLKTSLKSAVAQGATETILQGDHNEGAVILVKGEFGIYPRYTLVEHGHPKSVEVFVYTQTLVDNRHKALAQELVTTKAVDLPEGCDEEYLYEVFTEVSENHLLETIKRLAKDLPIYEVVFEKDGGFDVLDMGNV